MPTTRTSLGRPVQRSPYKKTMLIVHDPGQLHAYLSWACERLNHTHIIFEPIGNDPLPILLERMTLERTVAKRKTAEYDEVWLAIEASRHDGAVYTLAADALNGIQVAVAMESIERWLLDHFESAARDVPASQVRARLVQELPQYGGPLPRINNLSGRFEQAKARHPEPPKPLLPFAAVVDSIRESQRRAGRLQSPPLL